MENNTNIPVKPTGGKWEYKIYDNETFQEIEIKVGDLRTCVIPYLEAPAEANAAHIVKCVNSHEILLEALKNVLLVIDNSDEWWIDCPNKGGFDRNKIEEAIHLAIK